jgi:hypothetical protein
MSNESLLGILVVDSVAEPIRESTMILSDADLPEIYRRAGREARRWKIGFLWLFSSQLVLLYAGAVTGAASRYGAAELMTVLSLLCFLIVAALRLVQRFTTISDRWPAARWVAERTKSLAWSYAVGGVPFELDSVPAERARAQLGERLDGLVAGWRWGGSTAQAEEAATPAMQRLRAGSLSDRKSAYAAGRIEDQVAWYRAKAQSNAASGKRWDLAFGAISVAAIVGGVLQITGHLEFDILRLGGFAAALIVSWTGLNRHKRQAKIYRMTAAELSEIKNKIPQVDTETEWSHVVDRVESIIHREEAGWFEARS